MPLRTLPAVFMRGDTSRAIVSHARDLPNRAEWDPIFLVAMAGPDRNGRQLDGMGGGISSLSKVCIPAPSERENVYVDYTFAQGQIREVAVECHGNCGNLSSAVGPFAVDNACVIVRASDLELTGRGLPEESEQNRAVLEKLQMVRRVASVAMGIARDDADAHTIREVPFVAFVAPPMDAPTLAGDMNAAHQVDLTARFISSGQPHRALPLTASMSISVVARVAGTLANQASRWGAGDMIRIGVPSGILTVGADVAPDDTGAWVAHSGAFDRTARKLFDGWIYVPMPAAV